MQQHTIIDHFSGSSSWIILSAIESSIKHKIETAGRPLSQWDINIYRGVLTGCNEAFIINTEQREAILKNCQTEEEAKQTAEIIRPLLRGRDIDRYGYTWANLWLIATFPAKHYDIETFPALKQYLLDYGQIRLEQTGKEHTINGEKIKSRKKTNNKWFETQDSISYWDLFFQPKICWKAVGRRLAFAIVESGTYLTAPASFISAGSNNEIVLAFLCSAVGKYFIYRNSDTTGAGDIMLNIQSLIKFPVPDSMDSVAKETLKELVNRRINGEDTENKIDSLIYQLYGFSNEEILYIEQF